MDVSKYTEESKNKVRGLIITELEQVKDGERIFLPVDLMESLIFKKYPIKIPIWTGPFLRKIDLSKVDFTDTCYRGKAGSIIKVDKEGNSSKSIGIDLSYINAKIDFSVHPFEPNDVIIDSCNFEGVDLASASLKAKTKIFDSNFDNTAIHINKFDALFIRNSSFKNCDFSHLSLPIENIRNDDINTAEGMINNCDLSGTGLKLIITKKLGPFISGFNEVLESGKLDGCVFDGIIINHDIHKTYDDIINTIENRDLEDVKSKIKSIINNQISRERK